MATLTAAQRKIIKYPDWIGSAPPATALKNQMVGRAASVVEPGAQTRSLSILPQAQTGQTLTVPSNATPSEFTRIITDALNKRIRASKQYLSAPIQESMLAAQAGPDVTTFPGFSGLSPDVVANIDRMQQQGLTNRAQGLMGISSAFGGKLSQDLGNIRDILGERRAEQAALEAQQFQQQIFEENKRQFDTTAQNQSHQFDVSQQNQSHQFDVSQQNQSRQFDVSQQNQSRQFDVTAQMQALQQQAQQNYQDSMLQLNQQTLKANASQQEYQSNRQKLDDQMQVDNNYIKMATNPDVPRAPLTGEIDPQYAAALGSLYQQTSFAKNADPAKRRGVPRTKEIAIKQGWYGQQQPIANAAAAPGEQVNQEFLQRVMAADYSSPNGLVTPAGFVRLSMESGQNDLQKIWENAVANKETLGLSEVQMQGINQVLQMLGGKNLSVATQLTPGAQAAKGQALDRANIAINAVDAAIKFTEKDLTTGFLGAQMANIAGTDAYKLNQYLETIRAQVLMEALNSMRAASATGSSGMGQLSDREGMILQNSMGSLDIGLGAGILKENLAAIRNSLDRFRRAYAIELRGGEVRLQDFPVDGNVVNAKEFKESYIFSTT